MHIYMFQENHFVCLAYANHIVPIWFYSLYYWIEGLDGVSFCSRLEMSGEEDESGSTATVMFIGNDMLFISHVGDSCVVRFQF